MVLRYAGSLFNIAVFFFARFGNDNHNFFDTAGIDFQNAEFDTVRSVDDFAAGGDALGNVENIAAERVNFQFVAVKIFAKVEMRRFFYFFQFGAGRRQ